MSHSVEVVAEAYQGLKKYLDENAFIPFCHILSEYPIYIKVSRPRKTKLGDYRSGKTGEAPKISVNGNLNKYAFAVTLLHELAHHITFLKYGRKVAPHGQEWKEVYKGLFYQHFVNQNIFPIQVEQALIGYFNHTFASSCSDTHLLQVLNEYNSTTETYLKDVPENTVFLNGKRTFKKKEMIRKNFRIVDVHTGREYRANPLLTITPIID